MKKDFFKWQQIFLAVLVASAMVACDKEEIPAQDSEFTQEELAEMVTAQKFAAANSVYRALGLLNELPDNWESATYTPAEGVPVDEANTDIRNVISTGAAHAKSYFLSIVPGLGLNGDTWSHEGVGTLTYRAVNEANCYAVIDVNLVQMPGLKQLRFVPETVVGENSFDGEPYYRVGDVIRDKKKNIYWICVRPSGGPLKKDYAYFVSFDKSLIKTTTQSQTIYNEEDGQLTKVKNTYLTGKWIYAKNLVEERIAIAAGHTFAMFVGAMKGSNAPYYAQFRQKAEKLKQQGVIDFSQFIRMNMPDVPFSKQDNSFAIAYGSYEKNPYTKVRQEKYLQPMMVMAHVDLDHSGYIKEVVTKVWNEDDHTPSPYLLSLTNDYDPLSFYTFSTVSVWDEATNYTVPYDIMKYTTEYQGSSAMVKPQYTYMHNFLDLYVMVMTQMSLSDKGKPNSSYELVSAALENEQEPDYWESLELIHRYCYDEGVNMEMVEDIYE